MRRKQLYAIVLAGALATGGVPITAMAADAATEAGASEETGSTDAGESTDSAAEEQPTEAPAEPAAEAPAEPTEAPAEQPSEETEEQPTEAPAEQASEETAENTTQSEPTGIAINKTDADGNVISTEYYNTLQEAVDKVDPATEDSEAAVIEVSKQIALSSTINISGKRICIRAAEDISIGREGDFDEDMFAVSGADSELQFEAVDGKKLTVSGALSSSQASKGSIVKVSDGGSFGLGANVVLTGSNSSANGAAVNCTGGNIVLSGGTITGNTGAMGAVYSDSDISVQGSVSVKDNKIKDAQANIYLDQDAKFVVVDDMNNSSISFTHANAKDGLMVIEGAAAVDFKSAAEQFSYDTGDYTLDADTSAKTASLKKAATPTTTVTATPKVTATPTATTKPTATPTNTPSFLSYKSGTLKWVNHTTASLQMSVTKDCKWYYFYVDALASTDKKEIEAYQKKIANMYDASRATNSAKANTSFTVTAENVPESDTWMVVCAVPTSGKPQMRVFRLVDEKNNPNFKKKRPAASGNNTRAARTYKVSQSTISGLEEPLKFTPGTFYEFTVTGAGQNDEAPYVSGDERWIPMYWSLSENPKTSDDKNTTFRIGSPKGIADAKTYNIYVFFKKQVYNGSEWQDTDVIESVKTQFSSQKLSAEDLTITPTGDADGGSGSGGSGSATDAELTATEAATEKANGSSSKSAVSTMDESPIGTMVALAALSLLAGGYILIRKRKKDI